MNRTAPTAQRRAPRRSGFALVAMLLAILVIAALAVLLNGGASDGIASVRSMFSSTRAHFVAEAGLQHALWQARRSNCQTVPAVSGRSFGPGSYSYSVTLTGASAADVAATGLLPDGSSESVARRAVPVVATPTTVTLTTGLAGEETSIDDGSTATNFNAETVLRVSTKVVTERRGLLRFDLSSIPVGATVLSAELELTLLGVAPGGQGKIKLQRVTTQWSESAATWLQARPSVLWSVPGGDVTNATVAVASASYLAPGATRFDVTDQVQRWVSGTESNHGVLMTAGTGLTNVDFANGEDPNPAVHPKLTVSWACQCGVVCTLGPQLDKLLLVVANAASLSAQEAARKALIESWGYTVTVIDDSEPQAKFNTSLADALVAYVPETVDAAALGSKLTAASVGVVTEKMSSNLNIGTGWTSKLRSDIEIVENSHYITSPYPTGILIFLSSPQPISILSSGAAPDLSELATAANSGTGLGVVNTGGQLVGGGTAMGRRVQLPWGGTGFDFNALNDAGRNIMQRSIEWGKGTGAVATTYRTLNATADTYVYEAAQTSNFGAETRLMVGKDGTGSGKFYFSVVKFDVAAIPAGATLVSARLRLYANAFAGSGAMPTNIYQVLNSWNEMTAKWSTLSSQNNYGPLLLAADVALGTAGWREWSLPPTLVQEWISGGSGGNHGVAIKYEANSKNTNAEFSSREHATTANRPQLVVGYTQ